MNDVLEVRHPIAGRIDELTALHDAERPAPGHVALVVRREDLVDGVPVRRSEVTPGRRSEVTLGRQSEVGARLQLGTRHGSGHRDAAKGQDRCVESLYRSFLRITRPGLASVTWPSS